MCSQEDPSEPASPGTLWNPQKQQAGSCPEWGYFLWGDTEGQPCSCPELQGPNLASRIQVGQRAPAKKDVNSRLVSEPLEDSGGEQVMLCSVLEPAWRPKIHIQGPQVHVPVWLSEGIPGPAPRTPQHRRGGWPCPFCLGPHEVKGSLHSRSDSLPSAARKLAVQREWRDSINQGHPHDPHNAPRVRTSSRLNLFL